MLRPATFTLTLNKVKNSKSLAPLDYSLELLSSNSLSISYKATAALTNPQTTTLLITRSQSIVNAMSEITFQSGELADPDEI